MSFENGAPPLTIAPMITTQADRRPVVVGLGEVLWDLLPDGKQLGGAPANFAYHARQLGADGVVASCVGEDDLGRELLARLTALGLATGYVTVDPNHPTGTVGVTLDAHGKPAYVIHAPVAWDFIPTTDALLVLAASADAVCYGSLASRSPTSRQTIERFLDRTRRTCLRVCDVNLRQSFFSGELLAALIRRATLLKLNDEELPIIAKLVASTGVAEDAAADEGRHVEAILRAFPNLDLLAVTCGGAGSRIYASGGLASDAPAERVTVADTVGAGDAFTAALVTGLLRGVPLPTVHRHASRLAGFVCSQRGATPRIPPDLLTH